MTCKCNLCNRREFDADVQMEKLLEHADRMSTELMAMRRLLKKLCHDGRKHKDWASMSMQIDWADMTHLEYERWADENIGPRKHGALKREG